MPGLFDMRCRMPLLVSAMAMKLRRMRADAFAGAAGATAALQARSFLGPLARSAHFACIRCFSGRTGCGGGMHWIEETGAVSKAGRPFYGLMVCTCLMAHRASSTMSMTWRRS